jgi:hypothetical protein
MHAGDGGADFKPDRSTYAEPNAIANAKPHARTDGGAITVADTEPDAIAHAKPNAIANAVANAVANTQPHAACRSLQQC